MSNTLLSTHYGGFRLLRPVHAQLRLFAFLGRTAHRSQNGGLPVLVHMVSRRAGLFDYVELRSASRSRLRRCCLPLLTTGSASQTSFSELYPPAHRSLCLRFNRYLTITNAKLEARMVSLFLSCRAFSSPTICRFIPAHCQALFRGPKRNDPFVHFETANSISKRLHRAHLR